MKIGFDVSQTGIGKAGCGFVADSLLRSLATLDDLNEYLLYPFFGSDFVDPDALKTTYPIEQSRPNVTRIAPVKTAEGAKKFWDNFPKDGEKLLGSPDIIHSNNFYCPTELTQSKVVYTLHDVGFLEYPEFTTEANRLICFNGVLSAANYADFVVAVSRSSKDAFLKFFPHFPQERIAVIPLGSRFHLSRKEFEAKPIKGLQTNGFWLTVGTLEPRKNLRRLLKAFSLFKKKSQKQFPLVLAGGSGWMEDDICDYIQKLQLSDNIKYLGYVSDAELAWLYQNCFAFIFPSIYEGFGLPVLEAMGMGAAIITSKTTSLPEVAGDAAYYIDPYGIDDIIEGLTNIEKNSGIRLRLKNSAFARSKKFTWERSAETVMDIYCQVSVLPKR